MYLNQTTVVQLLRGRFIHFSKISFSTSNQLKCLHKPLDEVTSRCKIDVGENSITIHIIQVCLVEYKITHDYQDTSAI
jgi:hypothetical protein